MDAIDYQYVSNNGGKNLYYSFERCQIKDYNVKV